ANSRVCYCLGISSVDPQRGAALLFERFISRERNEPPDIDIDFEHERREEVLQYVYAKYGRERAALAATVIMYRPRSALRDLGKVFGLSAADSARLAKVMQWWDGTTAMGERLQAGGFELDNPLLQALLAPRPGAHRLPGLSPASLAARRRLRHRPRTARGTRADRERRHARAHRGAVGQG